MYPLQGTAQHLEKQNKTEPAVLLSVMVKWVIGEHDNCGLFNKWVGGPPCLRHWRMLVSGSEQNRSPPLQKLPEQVRYGIGRWYGPGPQGENILKGGGCWQGVRNFCRNIEGKAQAGLGSQESRIQLVYGGDAGRCQEGKFFFGDVVGEEVKCMMRRLRHQVRFYAFVLVWE